VYANYFSQNASVFFQYFKDSELLDGEEEATFRLLIDNTEFYVDSTSEGRQNVTM
jgi:hypothetical protein